MSFSIHAGQALRPPQDKVFILKCEGETRPNLLLISKYIKQPRFFGYHFKVINISGIDIQSCLNQSIDPKEVTERSWVVLCAARQITECPALTFLDKLLPFAGLECSFLPELISDSPREETVKYSFLEDQDPTSCFQSVNYPSSLEGFDSTPKNSNSLTHSSSPKRAQSPYLDKSNFGSPTTNLDCSFSDTECAQSSKKRKTVHMSTQYVMGTSSACTLNALRISQYIEHAIQTKRWDTFFNRQVKSKDIHQDYSNWSSDYGYHPVGVRYFTKILHCLLPNVYTLTKSNTAFQAVPSQEECQAQFNPKNLPSGPFNKARVSKDFTSIPSKKTRFRSDSVRQFISYAIRKNMNFNRTIMATDLYHDYIDWGGKMHLARFSFSDFETLLLKWLPCISTIKKDQYNFFFLPPLDVCTACFKKRIEGSC